MFKKKAIALSLAVLLIVGTLTGCNTGNTLFKYGDAQVSVTEAEVYARIQQYSGESQYGSYLGENMWSIEQNSGETLEDTVKDNVIAQIKAVKVLNAHASDAKVSLTKAEKKAAKENAKTFAEGDVGKKIMELSGADQELIDTIYEESTLASKVRQSVMDKVDTNVSDEDARVRGVYQLVFSTKKQDANGKMVSLSDKEKKKQLAKANKAYRALKKGADITALAQQYDIKDSTDGSYAKGKSQGGEKFEAAVEKLKVGEFTKVIACDDGYYIGKLTSSMDKEKTEENKQTVLQERQQEAYQKQYDKWAKDWEKDWDADKDINTKLWDKVTFKYGELTKDATTSTSTTQATTAATTETKK